MFGVKTERLRQLLTADDHRAFQMPDNPAAGVRLFD